jgi:hypothetical protein
VHAGGGEGVSVIDTGSGAVAVTVVIGAVLVVVIVGIGIALGKEALDVVRGEDYDKVGDESNDADDANPKPEVGDSLGDGGMEVRHREEMVLVLQVFVVVDVG